MPRSRSEVPRSRQAGLRNLSYKRSSPICRDEQLSWLVGCLKTQPDLHDHRIIFASLVLKCHSVLARVKMNLHFEPKHENSPVIPCVTSTVTMHVNKILKFIPAGYKHFSPFIGPRARFSKVPKTFWARKAVCETANRLFWKAGLLTCYQGNRKKNKCEV